MFKIVLLFLTLTGLQAVPIKTPGGLKAIFSNHQLPHGLQKGPEHSDIHEPIPGGFRQGIESSRRFLADVNTGLYRRGDFVRPSHRNGFVEMDKRPWLMDEVRVDIPVYKSSGGWMRVEEDSTLQAIKASMKIPDGFRQGTEPFMRIPDGFRQGTEPFMRIPDGFRQGTEPFMRIVDGYRQGTEPFMRIVDGYRQGTEPFMRIADGYRQGTEPFMRLLDGFRQGTEPSRLLRPIVGCKGEIINGICYEFNPTPLRFEDAQALCRDQAPNAKLASVTNGDLHSRLVSLVTKGGKNTPVLTWLGGMVKDQEASWVDGSEWNYSDWMPGNPNIQSDKPVCIEMFKIDESWWTAANCELKRASICSYPVTG